METELQTNPSGQATDREFFGVLENEERKRRDSLPIRSFREAPNARFRRSLSSGRLACDLASIRSNLEAEEEEEVAGETAKPEQNSN